EKELRRAKNILRSHWVFETESQYALTQKIGYFEAFALPDYVSTYLDRVERVTAADVLAAAKKYLKPENRTIGIGRAPPKKEPEKKEEKKDGEKKGGEKKDGDKRKPGRMQAQAQKSGPAEF